MIFNDEQTYEIKVICQGCSASFVPFRQGSLKYCSNCERRDQLEEFIDNDFISRYSPKTEEWAIEEIAKLRGLL